MKKVLFISYYWPPSAKASLHWPLKMIKFLPKFGWQPIVLTVDEDTFSGKDESLLKEVDVNLKVYKSKALEPFDIYKKFIGKKKDDQLIASETISKSNKSLTHRISIWIRMNLFVPDARVGWYFTAVKKGEEILSDEKIDAIVSVGPPHSSHLIGMKLSKRNNIPHIPVFIDPWVDIVYYKDFKRNKAALAFDNYLEKSVLKHSSAAVFVTRTMKDDYENKYDFLRGKSHVLYWGYNEDDFTGLTSSTDEKDEEILIHAGNIFDYQATPAFWENIRKEITDGRNLKIKFIGTVSPAIKELIEKNGLLPHTEYLGFLPYKEMLKQLLRANYLLVCATEKRHVPGKLFEYLRTGKPIIAFGDDNEEVKNILEEANAGMIFTYKENAGEFFNRAGEFKTDFSKIKKYDRENISFEFGEILNSSI